MWRLLFVLVILAACSGPQKSLGPNVGLGAFRSAIVPVAETPDFRAVSHIVALDGEKPFGLVTHVAFNADREPVQFDAKVDGITGEVENLSTLVSQGTAQSGLIMLSMEQMEQAAKDGFAVELCGEESCDTAFVPPGLFQQALYE